MKTKQPIKCFFEKDESGSVTYTVSSFKGLPGAPIVHDIIIRLRRCLHIYTPIGVVVLSVAGAAHAQDPLDPYRVACTMEQQQTISAALGEAKKLLGAAENSLPARNSAVGGKFQRWFGGPSGDDDPTIKSVYSEALTFIDFKTVWCPNSSFPGDDSADIAFVPSEGNKVTGEVFVLIAFFESGATGTDSQPGTIVHELVHLSTKRTIVDVKVGAEAVYGTTKSAALAASNPTDARRNADNYQYFVEDLLYGIPQ